MPDDGTFPVFMTVTSNITRGFLRTSWGLTDEQIDDYLGQGLTLSQIDQLAYEREAERD